MADTPRVTVPVEDLALIEKKLRHGGWPSEAKKVRGWLSASPAPEGGAVSPQVFRLLQLADAALANVTAFESDARYIMGNTNYAITDNARSEIRQFLLALATREEAPAEGSDDLAARLRHAETWDFDADQEARDRCGVQMLEAAERLENLRAQPRGCAAGAHPAPDALRVALEALEKASRAISAQYALAQAEYQHLDTVASKHDKIVQEGRRAIREALAVLQAEQGAK